MSRRGVKYVVGIALTVAGLAITTRSHDARRPEIERTPIESRAATTPLPDARVAVASRPASAKPRRTPVRIDLDVTVRDPSPRGWSARGRGRLVWRTPGVELERGRIQVNTASTRINEDTVIEGGSLEANVAGNLSSLALHGDALVRAARVKVGSIAATEVTLPVTFEASRAHVRAGRATLMGGTLAIEGALDAKADSTIAMRARGMQLAQLLKPTRRLTGVGLIDGSLQVAHGATGWKLRGGELRARGAGTIHVTDRGLRDQIAAARAPLAVHAAIADALLDFRYDALAVDLAPSSARVAIRGKGLRNRQVLDLTVRARDLRGGR